MSGYEVGDPDTTHSGDALGTGCDATEPGWGYICTLQEGHSGKHAAGNGTTISAVWGEDRAAKPTVALEQFYDIALYGALAHAREKGERLDEEEFRRLWDAAVEAR